MDTNFPAASARLKPMAATTRSKQDQRSVTTPLLLYLPFLLPSLQLFSPIPGLPEFSLDELFALTASYLIFVRQGGKVGRPVRMAIAIPLMLSLVNLGLLLRPIDAFEQVVNIFAFFTIAHVATSSTYWTTKGVDVVVKRVAFLYIGFGFTQWISWFVAPGIYESLRLLLNQTILFENGLLGPRVASILPEPSHFVQVLAFFLVYAFFSPYPSKLLGAAACAGLAVTGSALAVVALVVPVAAQVLGGFSIPRRIGILVAACITIVAEWQLHLMPSQARLKIDEFLQGLGGSEQKLDLNGSSRSLIHGVDVMKNTLEETAGLGAGLGSYNAAFNQFTPDAFREVYSNAVSGGGLIIRLVTELGILGAAIFLAAVVYCWPGVGPHRHIRWASLAVIIVDCVRLGGYTTGITALAAVLYFWPPRPVRGKPLGDATSRGDSLGKVLPSR